MTMPFWDADDMQYRQLNAWLRRLKGWQFGTINGISTVAGCFLFDWASVGIHRAFEALPGRAVVMIPLMAGLYAWLWPKFMHIDKRPD